MQAHCPEQPVAVLPNAKPTEGESHSGHFVYQGAILIVITLFLLSFWSC